MLNQVRSQSNWIDKIAAGEAVTVANLKEIFDAYYYMNISLDHGLDNSAKN